MNAKSRRAVSPVIATVILVAVAITITIAVAYWMGGIAGGYTKFEKVEMQSIVCQKITGGWNITVVLKNSGTAASTLNAIYVNDIPVSEYGALDIDDDKAVASMGAPGKPETTIDIGQSLPVHIYISDTYPSGKPYTSGTTVNVKFHSAGGMDYMKVVELV